MGELTNEPSMEEILSSIKRIIAEEGDATIPAPRSRASAKRNKAGQDGDEILELTDTMPDPELVSNNAASASRQALASLSGLSAQTNHGQSMDDTVREMLRPMLKEWLDKNLPDLVQSMVAREIARITNRGS